MKIINCEQGTKEWFDARKGHMTASHATAIGNAKAGLNTYIKEMMSEYYSSGEKEQFTSGHTDRGNELEPIARQVYEFENNVTVDEVGFIELNEYVGCSPDGLIGEDGGLEIKSPSDKEYIEYLIDGEDAIKSDYHWQVQMNLKITGRQWWDLMIYNPNFKKSYCIFRIYPDQEKFELLEYGFQKGVELINLIKSKIEC